jgi:hypothetical protein
MIRRSDTLDSVISVQSSEYQYAEASSLQREQEPRRLGASSISASPSAVATSVGSGSNDDHSVRVLSGAEQLLASALMVRDRSSFDSDMFGVSFSDDRAIPDDWNIDEESGVSGRDNDGGARRRLPPLRPNLSQPYEQAPLLSPGTSPGWAQVSGNDMSGDSDKFDLDTSVVKIAIPSCNSRVSKDDSIKNEATTNGNSCDECMEPGALTAEHMSSLSAGHNLMLSDEVVGVDDIIPALSSSNCRRGGMGANALVSRAPLPPPRVGAAAIPQNHLGSDCSPHRSALDMPDGAATTRSLRQLQRSQPADYGSMADVGGCAENGDSGMRGGLSFAFV